MIGRSAELREIERILSGARQHHGRAVCLIGEEGIGKSHIVTEIANRALTAGMCAAIGRGSTFGQMVPFRPIVEAVAGLCRSGDLPRSETLAPYRNVLGWLVPDFDGAGRREGVPSPIALAEAVLRLTAAAGEPGHGCVTILEDLQDTDPQTPAIFEYLADNLSREPSVLVITLRPEPGEALEVVRAVAQRGSASIIELPPLSSDEIREVAATLLSVRPAEVSDRVVGKLFRNSGGNPLLARELLHEMLRSGLMVRGSGNLLQSGELSAVPHAVGQRLSRHAARLGPHGRRLFRAAAVFGRRFPLSVVQAVTGIADDDMLAHLNAGIVSGFVSTSEPGWYSFSLPLTAEALLRELMPEARALLAGRAAEAVAALYPELPGDWCLCTANLLLDAGHKTEAAKLFAQAGGRAVKAGTPGPAVLVLDQALSLLVETDETALYADILDTLLAALTETGQTERALQFEAALDKLDTDGTCQPQMTTLHVRLGWAAVAAGRWLAGTRQLQAAQELLSPDSADELIAPCDALAAHLAAGGPGSIGDEAEQRASELARRAIARAELAGLPTIECQAWLALAAVARRHDTDEAVSCFEQAHALAATHRLTWSRLRAAAGLGFSDWLTATDTTRLDAVRSEAHQLGGITVGCDADASAALAKVLCGRYAEAAELIGQCLAKTTRLRLDGTAQYAQLAKATLAAHQDRRRDMNVAMAEFERLGGSQSDLRPLMLGLACVFCSLAEEDADRARDEIDQAIASGPGCYPLAGGHGLHLLLGALSGSTGWSRLDEISADPAARLRWNQQFVMFARAVLLGRDARTEQAAAAMVEAEHLAAPFPLARYLGLRLVAEAAVSDRWGDPADWLRRAEEHFHATLPAPASACRAVLRRIGKSVPQRRRGTDRVPRALRVMGMTLREYEVLELLADRPGNKQIADRLHISPRTVEKHVASLLIKSRQPDRAALCQFAADLLLASAADSTIDWSTLDAVVEVGDTAFAREHSDPVERSLLDAEMFEEPPPFTDQDRNEVDLEFVQEPSGDGALDDDPGTVDEHVPVASCLSGVPDRSVEVTDVMDGGPVGHPVRRWVAVPRPAMTAPVDMISS